MKMFLIRIIYYNAEYAKFLFIYFFLFAKAFHSTKKRNHFIAECNALANVNIDGSMSVSL